MIMKQIYTYIGAGLVALSFTNLMHRDRTWGE